MREFEAPRRAPRAAAALALSAAMSAALSLASCPNEAPSDPPVVGTWTSETGKRTYEFSSAGSITLTVSDPSPAYLPAEVVSIDSPEPGADCPVGKYVVTASARVYRCVVAGATAAGPVSALATADAALSDPAVGATVVDGAVTWVLVDEVIVTGLWTLDGSSLSIAWVGAGSRGYTVSFYASGGTKKMSLVALNAEGDPGAALILERVEP